MHIHILGISGTYMAGIALIAKDLGHKVTGHDQCCYSPMKDQLVKNDIAVVLGYDDIQSLPPADLFLVGNVIKRDNILLSEILNKNYNYCSAPEWLRLNVLNNKWVLAVSGTHGKTTTTAILVWLLEKAGLNPGFLVGGMLQNFGISARNTASNFFVIEADEYDTAFFDKRPKFLHYKPKTLIINNLEFDHADIYSSLDAIKQQFGYLLKTVPGNGRIIFPKECDNISALVADYSYSEVNTTSLHNTNADWVIKSDDNYHDFNIIQQGVAENDGVWQLEGAHNAANLLAAAAAANHVGVDIASIVSGISDFKSVKRRLELKGVYGEVTIYDDFGHHPTAIAAVLQSLSKKYSNNNIFAVLDLSAVAYTLRSGVVSEDFATALSFSQHTFIICNEDINTSFNWPAWAHSISYVDIHNNSDTMIKGLLKIVRPGDAVVCFGSKDLTSVFESLKLELNNVDMKI
jgi:UDP-N-acetylmuramate: L-alanyl-gamma-D-glutamyl-meso-diaminopimelate ligase